MRHAKNANGNFVYQLAVYSGDFIFRGYGATGTGDMMQQTLITAAKNGFIEVRAQDGAWLAVPWHSVTGVVIEEYKTTTGTL